MKRFSNKQAGILNYSDLKTAKGKIIYWTMFAILIFCCLITFVPALWMVLTAFKSSQEIYSSASFLPQNFTFGGAIDHITKSWNLLALGRSMLNTLIVSLGTVLVKIFVCGMAGYILSKRKVAGTKLIFALVIWTMMMPAIVRTVPTYMSYISFPFVVDDKLNSFTNLNILNTYWPIWIGAAADSFSIVLFKNNFDAVSDSIIEAAMLDGCGNLRIFTKIMIPIALPVVMFVSIGALSAAWADYFTPYLIIKDADLMTTPAKMFILKGNKKILPNVYMMGMIFSSIPSLIIFCLFQKWIMGGISLGGVKG